MSVKRFCDVCGDELARNVVTDRIKESRVLQNTKLEVEIMVGVNGVWNSGDVCAPCLFRALDYFDPRPRAA